MMCGSVPHIAAARTRQSTSNGPGRGRSPSRTAKSSGRDTTSARITPPTPPLRPSSASSSVVLRRTPPVVSYIIDDMAVNRAMLRDQIKDVLLQRILDGHYSPGQRIVETRVAEEFGVSQAPVREALRELEILRLVVSEPFRGARVRDVSTREIAQAYPVRAALEELAARLAAGALAGRGGAPPGGPPGGAARGGAGSPGPRSGAGARPPPTTTGTASSATTSPSTAC